MAEAGKAPVGWGWAEEEETVQVKMAVSKEASKVEAARVEAAEAAATTAVEEMEEVEESTATPAGRTVAEGSTARPAEPTEVDVEVAAAAMMARPEVVTAVVGKVGGGWGATAEERSEVGEGRMEAYSEA